MTWASALSVASIIIAACAAVSACLSQKAAKRSADASEEANRIRKEEVLRALRESSVDLVANSLNAQGWHHGNIQFILDHLPPGVDGQATLEGAYQRWTKNRDGRDLQTLLRSHSFNLR